MLALRKPSPISLSRFITIQSSLEFTYSGVGTTAVTPPPGYTIDHRRVVLGHGEDVFAAARSALLRWKQFDIGWAEAWPPDTPLKAGATVAVVIRAFGLVWINSARIVYVVDESSDSNCRFGFAYGTLPGHVEAGEERFLVEWDRRSDEVFYDIFAFSRPRHLLTRLGRFQVRRMQKRFARDSAAAMQIAVQEIGS
jgi:uncharacterized protein (UPF0548 family)